MFKMSDLKIKIFADGAKLEDMLKAYKEGWVAVLRQTRPL